jgi:hypothetical protein
MRDTCGLTERGGTHMLPYSAGKDKVRMTPQCQCLFKDMRDTRTCALPAATRRVCHIQYLRTRETRAPTQRPAEYATYNS